MTSEKHQPTVFVYPGQGSIEGGQVNRVIDIFETSKALFKDGSEYASEKLGINIGALMLEKGQTAVLQGEEVGIHDTRLAQPCTLISSVVGSNALTESIGRKPDMRTYHSFGLIATLHDRGVYNLQQAIDLAIDRGESMHQAQIEKPGGMAAFFGYQEEALIALCKKWGIWYANDNSHTEGVLSGAEGDIDAAVAAETTKAEEGGGNKPPVRLKVKSGAHTPLVATAGEYMGHRVDAIKSKVHVPDAVQVFSSRTLELLKSFDDIRADIAGLSDMVHWRTALLKLIDGGYVEFYETGPGSKLSRLPRRDPITAKHLRDHGAFMISIDQILDKRVA